MEFFLIPVMVSLALATLATWSYIKQEAEQVSSDAVAGLVTTSVLLVVSCYTWAVLAFPSVSTIGFTVIWAIAVGGAVSIASLIYAVTLGFKHQSIPLE